MFALYCPKKEKRNQGETSTVFETYIARKFKIKTQFYKFIYIINIFQDI